ncbi:MAG: hypothetical protein CVV21_12150 [Candidatus Goldiibacteriota bacterium HGW-Goldbacteria-1]|jgi:hypothetical protein|nr:MAG: hypothetical protein CVV21_12150 [Candidatus Goldiibacteriota bacterium HGW-Goldbacteria-1]
MKRLLFLLMVFIFAAGLSADDFDMSLEFESSYSRAYYRQALISGSYLIPQMPVSAVAQKAELTLTKELDDLKLNLNGELTLNESIINTTVNYAYAVMSNGPFTASFGKQRVRWGTGYMWNPSDVLQLPKNSLDPESTVEGTYSARLEYSGEFFTPSVIVSAVSANDEGGLPNSVSYAFQLYKLVGTADIFINGAYLKDYVESIGAAVSWDADIFVVNLEGAAIRYRSNAPNIMHVLKPSDSGKILPGITAGLSKRLSDSFFISAEYYYNGWGLNNADYAAAAAGVIDNDTYMSISRGLMAWPKRHYAGASLSYTWLDTITLTATGIYGADDGAFYAFPALVWNPSENYGFTAEFLYNFCDSRSAQGVLLNPVRSVLNLKFNAYF